MSTIYLRFPDEVAFLATLPAEFEQQGETGSPLPAGVEAISIVGTISEGGQWDEAGNVITPPTMLPGWHVNMLGAVPAEWAAYVVTPTTPVRVFGGEA